MQIDTETIRGLFTQHDIRCTKQREDIYSILWATRSHPTAEELFREARRIQPGLSLATVYNTLEVFTERGLCRRIGHAISSAGASGACRYDADLSHHAHLVTPDGRVVDIPERLAKDALAHISDATVRRIESEMGVEIERISIDFIARPAACTRPT